MPTKSCREKAMDLLSRRSHFRRELESKLAQRGYEDDEVRATVDRLEEQGFVDDDRTAAEFVEGRLRRGPVGPRKLIADLQRRGVEGEAARTAVDEAFPDGDLDLAREAAERKLARSVGEPGAPLDADERHRLLSQVARHLERKGFAGSSVGRVVSEWRDRLATT